MVQPHAAFRTSAPSGPNVTSAGCSVDAPNRSGSTTRRVERWRSRRSGTSAHQRRPSRISTMGPRTFGPGRRVPISPPSDHDDRSSRHHDLVDRGEPRPAALQRGRAASRCRSRTIPTSSRSTTSSIMGPSCSARRKAPSWPRRCSDVASPSRSTATTRRPARPGRWWSRATPSRSSGSTSSCDALDLPLFPWHAAPKHRFVRIEPVDISGRRFEVVARPADRPAPRSPARGSGVIAVAGAPPSAELFQLDRATCMALLGTQDVGRLVVVEDGEPRVIPVNYAVVEGSIVIRCDHDRRTSIAGPVVFEVDLLDERTRSGWSVIVRGPPRTWTPRDRSTRRPRHHVGARPEGPLDQDPRRRDHGPSPPRRRVAGESTATPGLCGGAMARFET